MYRIPSAVKTQHPAVYEGIGSALPDRTHVKWRSETSFTKVAILSSSRLFFNSSFDFRHSSFVVDAL